MFSLNSEGKSLVKTDNRRVRVGEMGERGQIVQTSCHKITEF